MKTFLCTCVCAGLLFFAGGCTDTEDPITPMPEPDPEPTSLRSGLLFHTPFSGNANDIGLYGLSGTVTGATLTTDRHGNANEAYQFDGIDDVIDYGEARDLTLGDVMVYTIAAWVKLEDRGDTQRQTIITKFNQGVAAGWFLSVNGDQKIQTYRNQPPWSIASENAVPYGEYVHVAATYDGSNLAVWLNGELDGTVNFGRNDHDRNTHLLIGGIHSQNEVLPRLKGVVDEVRIYNRLLTEEERTWLANN